MPVAARVFHHVSLDETKDDTMTLDLTALGWDVCCGPTSTGAPTTFPGGSPELTRSVCTVLSHQEPVRAQARRRRARRRRP